MQEMASRTGQHIICGERGRLGDKCLTASVSALPLSLCFKRIDHLCKNSQKLPEAAAFREESLALRLGVSAVVRRQRRRLASEITEGPTKFMCIKCLGGTRHAAASWDLRL